MSVSTPPISVMRAYEKINNSNRAIHWSWSEFWTKNENHGNNQSASKVWCKACVKREMDDRRTVHLVADGVAGLVTEDSLFLSGASLVLILLRHDVC